MFNGLDIATLILIVVGLIGGLFCLAYLLRFHTRADKSTLRDFDSPWLVRAALCVLFILWLLGHFVRLPWLRAGRGPLHSLALSSQANLCKLHLVWSLGFVEPSTLLIILFLLQTSLESPLSSSSRSLNSRVLPRVGLSCLPVFTLHLVLTLMGHRKTFGDLFPSYFTRSYHYVLVGTQKDQDKAQIVLCTTPLFSVLASACFSAFFIAYFAFLSSRLVHGVINRKLRLRFCTMALLILALLPFHVIFLGIPIKMDPTLSAFEMLMFLRFLALLICLVAAIAVLVIMPVVDATAVCYFFEKRDEAWQSVIVK